MREDLELQLLVLVRDQQRQQRGHGLLHELKIRVQLLLKVVDRDLLQRLHQGHEDLHVVRLGQLEQKHRVGIELRLRLQLRCEALEVLNARRWVRGV